MRIILHFYNLYLRLHLYYFHLLLHLLFFLFIPFYSLYPTEEIILLISLCILYFSSLQTANLMWPSLKLTHFALTPDGFPYSTMNMLTVKC